jgi:hypothetical protein
LSTSREEDKEGQKRWRQSSFAQVCAPYSSVLGGLRPMPLIPSVSRISSSSPTPTTFTWTMIGGEKIVLEETVMNASWVSGHSKLDEALPGPAQGRRGGVKTRSEETFIFRPAVLYLPGSVRRNTLLLISPMSTIIPSYLPLSPVHILSRSWPRKLQLTTRSDYYLRPRQCRNGGFLTSLQSRSTDQRSRCRKSTRPHDRRITNQRLGSSRSTISRQSSRTSSQRPPHPLSGFCS